MKTVTTSVLLLLAVSAAVANATPADDQPVQSPDPIEPARPTGFERRDAEEMDRRIEARREEWRAEQEAKARAKRQGHVESDHGPDSTRADQRR